jgi:prepilin-type N-terminal cleavage/methylation domain-containing protein
MMAITVKNQINREDAKNAKNSKRADFLTSRSLRLRGEKSSRSAFTLIELMVVMGVILILIGLLFAGMKQWQANANRQVTLQRMQMLQGMMSELEAQGRNQFQSQWFMNGNTANALLANTYCSMNVDNQPVTGFVGTETLVVTTPPSPWVNNRAQAIADTSETIMTQLVALPNNAKALSGLPSNATIPGATSGPSGTARTTTSPPFYPAAPAWTAPVAAGTTFGPVVLDGWGNPIIFVPASGLANVYVNSTSSSPTLLTTPIQSPDHRPFWASAGPDGDFVRGDDNIYSFSP